ncbi:hypothetical protein HHK36_028562 [Tetracentron sinense]|uniref:UMP-CMP kinase n=1 Tax=Tetracentron sinense TaxID=13715 RepID=A0A834YB94_TETSI|nr:hypothetical protein HHK36_028562 [Tetracentron sinense]
MGSEVPSLSSVCAILNQEETRKKAMGVECKTISTNFESNALMVDRKKDINKQPKVNKMANNVTSDIDSVPLDTPISVGQLAKLLQQLNQRDLDHMIVPIVLNEPGWLSLPDEGNQFNHHNEQEANGSLSNKKKVTVVFVLGGPGSGKGTQCANVVQHFGFTHLSAGDLLRAEIKSGSENGTMIQNMIKEGKIVPSEVTVKLLQRAMQESDNDKFLIDGFPRNEENRAAFEKVTEIEPEFVLFFECSEEEMERRLLNRNQGREDDNIDTIRKRFKVFLESSLPVVEYYGAKGRVRKIDAGKPIEEVFETVKAIFTPISEKVKCYLRISLFVISIVDTHRHTIVKGGTVFGCVDAATAPAMANRISIKMCRMLQNLQVATTEAAGHNLG